MRRVGTPETSTHDHYTRLPAGCIHLDPVDLSGSTGYNPVGCTQKFETWIVFSGKVPDDAV